MDFGVKMDEGPPADVNAGSDYVGGGVTGGGVGSGGIWQGMTIKDILEKVDLFNITTLDEDDEEIGKQKADIKPDIKPNISGFKEPKKVVVSAAKPESAFLGPKIWKNPITLPMLNGSAGNGSGGDGTGNGGDAEFSIMNIDDFLNENNFDLNRISPPLPDDEILGLGKEATAKAAAAMQQQQQQMLSPQSVVSDDSMDMAGNVSDSGFSVASPSSAASKKNLLPKQGENSFLYAESKRAKIERERLERKRKMEVQIDFAPEDLALATIPGADFDPKRRHFSPDELRPQPIIRKRKKTYVMSDDKDDKYWERREKNNVAARRSREARRLKENQIALRTAYLEKENFALQTALDKSSEENKRLNEENKNLREALERYETGMLAMN